MLKRNLALYGGLLLLCQLLSACNLQNNDNRDGVEQENIAAAAQNDGGEPAKEILSNEPEINITIFGDSLYAGYRLGPKEGLAPMLQQNLRAAGHNVAVRNAGVSGDTSAGGLRRLEFLLSSGGSDTQIMLVGLGGNDMLRGIPPSETRTNLDKILAELKRRGIDVIVTGMLAAPNLGPDYAREFNVIFPQLAKKYDAALYPFILEGVLGNGDLMLGDDIHPNAKGVVRMVDGIAPIVEQQIKALD